MTIDYAQHAPVATDDNATNQTVGQPVTIDLLGNDTDADGDINASSVELNVSNIPNATLSADGKTAVVPGEGNWTVDSSGKLTFTPAAGFTGDPTPIGYTVKDNTGLVSNGAKVTIDYAQQPPVATNDEANATVGNKVTIDILANDQNGSGAIEKGTIDLNASSVGGIGDDTDGDGYIDKVTVPGEGVWEVNTTTGKLTFTPEPGFTGSPTPIGYTVKDSNGETSSSATVTLHYSPAPVAKDDSANGVKGHPVTIDVLANDVNGTDPLDPVTVMMIDPDTNASVQTLYVNGEGTWEVNTTNGAITFTPETGFTGDPTPVEYTVEDAAGRLSNHAKMTINYSDGKPKATDNLNIPVQSTKPFVIDVLANGDDFGAYGPASRPIEFTQPAHGNVYLDDGGTPNDPTDDVMLYQAEPDFIGKITFTYTIYDAQGNASTATVTLNVDCSSSQMSDSSGGDALGILGSLMMLLGLLLMGRREMELGIRN